MSEVESKIGIEEPSKLQFVIPSNPNETIMDANKPLLFSGARGKAVRILSRVESSPAYVDRLIEQEVSAQDLDQMDRALLLELVYGVLRWQSRLDWILTGFYHGEFTKCITPVKNSMRVALYQLLMLSKIPASQAINETVSLIKRIKDEKSGGIIGGVLKNIYRNINNIRYPNKEENIQLYFSVVLSHPLWMVKRWFERFGEEQTERLLTANNERPVIHLRVNNRKASSEQISQWLAENNLSYEISQHSADYLRINALQYVPAMDIYHKGMVSISDASNHIVLQLAQPKNGQTIIDFGSFYGRKALAFAEMLDDSTKVILVDRFEEKLKAVSRHAERLGISSLTTIATHPAEYNGEKGDILIVEPPSTEFGMLAKKPDIKWRNELDDVRKHHRTQKAYLENASAFVKKGGVILYTVPSFEPEETTMIVEDFLQRHPEFVLDSASSYVPESMVFNQYMLTLPHVHKIDGVFAARLIHKG